MMSANVLMPRLSVRVIGATTFCVTSSLTLVISQVPDVWSFLLVVAPKGVYSANKGKVVKAYYWERVNGKRLQEIRKWGRKRRQNGRIRDIKWKKKSWGGG